MFQRNVLIISAVVVIALLTIARNTQAQLQPFGGLPIVSPSTTQRPGNGGGNDGAAKDPQRNRIIDTKAPLFPSDVASAISITKPLTREVMQHISSGAEKFGLDLYKQISDTLTETHITANIVTSPFALWSLLVLLVEGADGRTLQQLQTALRIEENNTNSLRLAFAAINEHLQVRTSTVEVASLQALFTEVNSPLRTEYETIIESYYRSKIIGVNFHDPIDATNKINYEANLATRGLIKNTILPQDLKGANLILISSLYFKGQWKLPFNSSLTREEMFYDEHGKPLGNVEMMFQHEHFIYTRMPDLEAHVLELPYGRENRLSMLVILPNRNILLNKVVHNLENVGIPRIFDSLTAASKLLEDVEIELYFPKFMTSSDFKLREILEKMGVYELFNMATANLTKMARDVFVKDIIQTVKIIVNEEGTEAAAVTTATLFNKLGPQKFIINRPFLYLIVEKTTNVLLFAGQVVKPDK